MALCRIATLSSLSNSSMTRRLVLSTSWTFRHKSRAVSEEGRLHPNSDPEKKPFTLDLTFTDARAAYVGKTKSELLRALFVYRLCGVDAFVEHQEKIMKLSQLVLGKRLFKWIMKRTFYGQFAAGENREEVEPIVCRNKECGVRSMLQYSVEAAITTPHGQEGHSSTVTELSDSNIGDTDTQVAICNRNVEMFLTSIDFVADTSDGEGFGAIKVTALGSPEMLQSVTDVMEAVTDLFDSKALGEAEAVQFQKFTISDVLQAVKDKGINLTRADLEKLGVVDLEQDGVIDLGEWKTLLGLAKCLSKLQGKDNKPLVPSLSTKEEEQLKDLMERMDRVMEYAANLKVRVMIDAEQTYLQPAIRRLTVELMKKYNIGRSVVYSTYQCYLKKTFDCITEDILFARQRNFRFGAKIVRGAYMDEERERAATLGYDDPVNPNFEATSKMYHRVVEEVMRQCQDVPKGEIAVMVASHNEDSIRFALNKMEEYSINPDDGFICFGQVCGLGDPITFMLGQAGYPVYKCLHYGPVDKLLAYLGRRAQENRGVLTKVQKEKSMLRQELKRRLISGVRSRRTGEETVHT